MTQDFGNVTVLLREKNQLCKFDSNYHVMARAPKAKPASAARPANRSGKKTLSSGGRGGDKKKHWRKGPTKEPFMVQLGVHQWRYNLMTHLIEYLVW